MINMPLFKGRLIAIGGNEDKVDKLVVLKRVVQEVDKSAYKVCVITSASEEPEQRGKEYMRVFQSLGARAIVVLDIRTRAQANSEILARTVEDCDLFFFAGGDQLRLTTIIGGSTVLNTIRKRLGAGALIAGTSAGAAVFSDTMIYDGRSEEGLFKGSVHTTPGFGFIKNMIFDTHFMTRGRIGRLVQIITTNPSCIGVGIGEDSGVIMRGHGILDVIGSGQVIIVDGGNIGHSNIIEIEAGGPIAVENISIHSLVNGYGYNVLQRRFLLPSQNQHGEKETT